MQKARGFAWNIDIDIAQSIKKRVNIPVLPGVMLSAMLINIEIAICTPSLYMRGLFILRRKLTFFFSKKSASRGCVVMLKEKKNEHKKSRLIIVGELMCIILSVYKYIRFFPSRINVRFIHVCCTLVEHRLPNLFV